MEYLDDVENHRYVARDGDEVAGYTVYHIRGDGIYFFVHTVIEEAYQGRGVGKELAQSALDDVRAKGGLIIPICPFIHGFVQRNPEYDDLVDHALFDQINARIASDGA